MNRRKHYFIEQNDRGLFAVRATGSRRASRVLHAQKAYRLRHEKAKNHTDERGINLAG